MTQPGTQPAIGGIAPFFIVRDVSAALTFYSERLGFSVVFREPEVQPFLAIVRRDGAMIFLKSVDAEPLPNCRRHPDARWDAYLNVPDPDALEAEFRSQGAGFSVPPRNTEDGLRGFELRDADGYTLFFGRPR